MNARRPSSMTSSTVPHGLLRVPLPLQKRYHLLSNSTPINGSRPQSLCLADYAKDDTAVRIRPWGNVDYLSHSWKEEDIRSSWKYIVSEREAYNDGTRLENASWRTWATLRDKLNTVDPESLNW